MAGDIDVVNNKSKLDMVAIGQRINVISIGSDTFMSMDGGSTYIKSPTNFSAGLDAFTQMWNSFNSSDVDRAKDALKDGIPRTERVGNDDTRHMTASTKDLGSLGATGGSTVGTIDMWITTGDKPIVRKMKIAGTTDDKEIIATVEWTNIDQTFTIEAPATMP